MKELKAPEKVTQKMTHDGAVAENLATGEVERISGREEETCFDPQEETVSFTETAVKEAAHAHTRHRERKAARKGAKAVREGSETRQRPSSRLQFTDEERADPALRKYIERSDRAADKLDAAKAKIPTKTVKVKERVFDETTGKGKTSIRFEEMEKKPNGKLRHNPLGRPAQEISLAAHNKVHEVEQENVGVEAGHKTEELGERGVLYAGSKVRQALHHHETKPWRDAAKAEQAANKANAEVLYQKAIRDDPSLAASNPVSRYLQKKRIQRNYAKDVRQAEKNAQKTATAAKTAAVRTKEAAQKTAAFVKKHSKVILPIIGIAGILVMLIGGVSSCSMMAGSGISSVFSSSYLSEDSDMMGAEAAYCAMEAELQAYLDTYESTHSYDEYHYELDDIEHDPYVLISILSALHEGIFTFADVQDDLEMLFEKQYILTETVETETRYRTEIETVEQYKRDPVTGQIIFDEYGWPVMEEVEVEVEVPYTYYICTVELENFNLSHVPVYIMGEDTLSMYATYMGTLGNREDLFPDSGYVSKYTEPPDIYEIPPSALEDETFATLIAEAEKYIGYPYVWGGSNPNTSFDCSGFVSWVLTNSGLCNTGRLGAQGLYNISTPVSSSNVKPGDLVFFVGTYDTPGISHVGIYVGGGVMLHCGDPIQYANLNSAYWQNHFYAFARPPYN